MAAWLGFPLMSIFSRSFGLSGVLRKIIPVPTRSVADELVVVSALAPLSCAPLTFQPSSFPPSLPWRLLPSSRHPVGLTF